MGPRSIDRGILVTGWTEVSRCTLQWGRDQLIAELKATTTPGTEFKMLQWGRDQLIAEFNSSPRNT